MSVPVVLAQADATVVAAFGAGLLSFVSPCVLPLVPGYLSTITGVAQGVGTVTATTPTGGTVGVGAPARPDVGRVLWPAVTFCLSFTFIFVALGMFATGIGAPLAGHSVLLDRLSGGFLVLFGLLLVLTPFVTRLNRDWRPTGLIERAGSGGPLVAGAAFAIAWTPCTGPVLGAILTTAAQRGGVGGGAFLLLAYSAGLAVPFLASALAFDRLASTFRWIRDHHHVLSVVSGAILVVLGVLVFRSEMPRVTQAVREAFDGLGLDLGFFER